MTWAIHVTLAPSWLDPSETLALATPYMLLYALHDALVKPMPDNPMSPSLAIAWRESEDGRTYDFELRQGVKFHNSDPFTAEDVQFSFERYRSLTATTPRRPGNCSKTPAMPTDLTPATAAPTRRMRP
jgi:peptide/nickel transport system substrate-binding protein